MYTVSLGAAISLNENLVGIVLDKLKIFLAEIRSQSHFEGGVDGWEYEFNQMLRKLLRRRACLIG